MKAKNHVAPVIRGAFLRALDIVQDKRGLTFSQLLAEEIENKGLLHVMDKVGRYVERESSIDLTSGGESLVGILGSLGRAEHDPKVESEPGTIRH